MLEQKPQAVFDEDGMMRRGVILRHLVLPGNLRQTYLLLDWMEENIPKETYISLMGQYFPAGRAADFPEINRRLKPGEYQRACSRLLGKGFDHGFFQDLESASGEYVPDFDLSGLEAEE